MTALSTLKFTETIHRPLRGMENLPNSGPNLSFTSQNNGKEEDPKTCIDKKIEALLSQFSNAFKKTFDAQFEKGDIIIEIEQLVESRDEKAPELKKLHSDYFSNHSISYVSKLRTTAGAYSEEERAKIRETGASFADCYFAIDLSNRLKSKRQLPESTPPSDVVDMVRTSKKSSPKAIAKGIALKIKATRYINRMAEYQKDNKGLMNGGISSSSTRTARNFSERSSSRARLIFVGSIRLTSFEMAGDHRHVYQNAGWQKQ